jgi:hypothetical protein
MKRIAIVLASVLVVSVMAGSAAAGGPGPGDPRIYRGETTDGGTVRFRVTRTDTGREIRGMLLETELNCDDGTTKPERLQLADWGWTFEGRTAIVDENRPLYWGLRMVGQFRPASASGTLRYSWTQLLDDHTAQLCTTGDVEWSADRIMS